MFAWPSNDNIAYWWPLKYDSNDDWSDDDDDIEHINDGDDMTYDYSGIDK